MKRCLVCGQEFEPAWNRPEQKYCSAKCREKAKQWYPREVDTTKPIKLCEFCGNEYNPSKFSPQQRFCSKKCVSASYGQRRSKPNYQQMKKEAFAILGVKCECCKTEDQYVLTIDHINNDGKKDRRRQRTMFRFIINNPEKAKKIYQSLCWNCNALKHFYPKEYARRAGLGSQDSPADS